MAAAFSPAARGQVPRSSQPTKTLPEPRPQQEMAFQSSWHIPKLGIKMPNMGRHSVTKGSRTARRRAPASGADGPTSVADALFTTTQQRVLALLFGQPVRSFFATELNELTGSGSGAVRRELKRLSRAASLPLPTSATRSIIRPLLTPPFSRNCEAS